MEKLSNHFIEISEENELSEIDGGWVGFGLRLGIVVGGIGLLDTTYEFVQGVRQGFTDHIK